jgi:two-component system, OmpR family, alkaline phosphatase synthesis response regulator PhoP
MVSGKVLVVDDELQYVDVVAFKFRNAGLEVVTAMDGQEALQKATLEPVGLIVCDYQMPGMDGLALCRRLRAIPETARIPFILLTAHVLDVKEEAIREAGVTLVLSKPFSPRDLLARAIELLSQPKHQTV